MKYSKLNAWIYGEKIKYIFTYWCLARLGCFRWIKNKLHSWNSTVKFYFCELQFQRKHLLSFQGFLDPIRPIPASFMSLPSFPGSSYASSTYWFEVQRPFQYYILSFIANISSLCRMVSFQIKSCFAQPLIYIRKFISAACTQLLFGVISIYHSLPYNNTGMVMTV